MAAGGRGASARPGRPDVPVDEVRDYEKINGEVVRLLDEGHDRIRLTGVNRQRLLLLGLRGSWSASILVDGPAGPELGAEMDAPDLTVFSRGASDGAGRSLRSGRIVILGDAGDVTGYLQRGGTILVIGRSGSRSGLGMSGGNLILLGESGRLTGERQSGGYLLAADSVGPNAGYCRGGGLFDRGAERSDSGEISRLRSVFPNWPPRRSDPAVRVELERLILLLRRGRGRGEPS